MPGGERIRVTTFPQIVLVLVNDERPPDNGELPLKQRDLVGGKMERTMPVLCCSYVPKIPRVRAYAGARPVLRIRGIEMPAAAGAVAAQQVAELVHVEPVLSRRQVFNVTRNPHRRKRVVLFERHVTALQFALKHRDRLHCLYCYCLKYSVRQCDAFNIIFATNSLKVGFA